MGGDVLLLVLTGFVESGLAGAVCLRNVLIAYASIWLQTAIVKHKLRHCQEIFATVENQRHISTLLVAAPGFQRKCCIFANV